MLFSRRSLLGALLAAVLWNQPLLAETPPTTSHHTFHVVGYLPEYRFEQFEPRICQGLTDLIFFSVTPEPNGKITTGVIESPKAKELLKKIRADFQVKVHLCVGGWGRSKGFAEIATSTDSRRRFASELVDLCRQHGFDGADIDWEHPENDEQVTNYGLLLAEIAKQFKPHELQLTVAMASWQRMTPVAIESVTAFHLMSYDGPGKHSTFDMAKADAQKLIEMGVPQAKIRLGLPFYGRGVTKPDHVKTYAEIVTAVAKQDLRKLDQDEVGGVYFNGPSTIRAKTQWAKDQRLGGVMAWELGQDASGSNSLLKVISATVKSGVN